jgi:predicted TIM-barrel fold metal-dependent hydrolase
MNNFHEISPYICDSHVHVGKFGGNKYISPKMVGITLSELGIKKWVVSSTSTVDNDFPLVIKELNDLINISSGRAVPILWITPEMVEFSKDLSYYLNYLDFFGFKIHPFTEKWSENTDKLISVFRVAEKLEFPILIHTGWTPESNASNFNSIIKQFPKVKTILAHGRPIEQAIDVLNNNDNAYVDTAFMPTGDIRKLDYEGFENKIIFGSDFPIEKFFYKRISLKKRYKNRIEHLIRTFGINKFMKWSNENYGTIYPL